ncbi:hypothetical protein ACFOHW_19935 [Paenibacillus abyssi]|uniref:hypothetical protein n=1 Tax=Paenibacillus abyssi TaxID=1340531 RepID=UPI00360BEF08
MKKLHIHRAVTVIVILIMSILLYTKTISTSLYSMSVAVVALYYFWTLTKK